MAASFSFAGRAAGPEEAVKVPLLRPAHAEILPSFWEQYCLWIVLAGLVMLALAALIVWLLTRPQPPVVLSPEEEARQALAALTKGATDGATLSQASQILRRYIRRTFNLPLHEQTTTEFCRLLENNREIGPGLALLLGGYFRVNDFQKFHPGMATLPKNIDPAAQVLLMMEKCETLRANRPAASAPSPDQPA